MSRTRSLTLPLVTAVALLACGQLGAQESLPPPEDVIEAMSVKLLRGVVNVLTCPLELPRQLDRQIEQRGPWEGSCVGLVAGLGMTAFRGVAGAVEAAAFLVPPPGFYEPLCNPAFVWDGWDGWGLWDAPAKP